MHLYFSRKESDDWPKMPVQLMDRLMSIVAVKIFKERTIFFFLAVGVVIKICFKAHGYFEDVETVVR